MFTKEIPIGNHSQFGDGESVDSQVKNNTSVNLSGNKTNDTIYNSQYLDCPNLTEEGSMISKITNLI